MKTIESANNPAPAYETFGRVLNKPEPGALTDKEILEMQRDALFAAAAELTSNAQNRQRPRIGGLFLLVRSASLRWLGGMHTPIRKSDQPAGRSVISNLAGV